MDKFCHKENDALHEIIRDCSKSGWDGYDADPVNVESTRYARMLLVALPSTVERPDISPNLLGEICLEWRKKNEIIILLSSNECHLTYAALIKDQKYSGITEANHKIPEKIKKDLIEHFSI